MPATTTAQLRTMDEIIQCVKATRSHFFDADAMRFFNCRLASTVYPTAYGTFFVTSERNEPNPRRYTVRFCVARHIRYTERGRDYTAERAEILSAGDAFQKHGTSAGAHQEAQAEAARLLGLTGTDPVVFDF